MKKSLQEAIKIELSEKEPCLMEAKVVVPSENIDAEIEKSVKMISKQAQIPGFRAGKVPIALIKKRFTDNINDELIQNIHVATYQKLKEISKTELVSMPTPENEIVPPVANEDYTFNITVNVAPEIEIPKYEGLKLKKESVTVEKKAIDAEIARIREMYADYTTIDEAGKKDDMLKISYTSNLEPLEEALPAYDKFVKADDTWCWLSDPEMIPGIIKALIGAKAGDEKTLSTTFPDDFTEPSLIGKKADFKITVVEVQRRLPLKSDEEFCKRINVPDMKTFSDQIEKNMETQESMKSDNLLKEEAMSQICDKITVKDFPPLMLAQAINMEFRVIANNLVKKEEDVEAFKKDKDVHQKAAEETARKQLSKFFICNAIALKEDISVSQEEIENQIKSMSQSYGYKPEEFKKHLEESGSMDQMHMEMLISKVNDLLIAKANITDPNKKADPKKADSKESSKSTITK